MISIDVGDRVVCDACDVNFTNSDAVGGLLFQSKAICPVCTPRLMKSVEKFGEQRFIRGRAEPGETFKAFVLRIRGGNNTITVLGAG